MKLRTLLFVTLLMSLASAAASAQSETASTTFFGNFAAELAQLSVIKNISLEEIERSDWSVVASPTTGDLFFVLGIRSGLRPGQPLSSVRREFYFFVEPRLLEGADGSDHRSIFVDENKSGTPGAANGKFLVSQLPAKFRAQGLARRDGLAAWGHLATQGTYYQGYEFILANGRKLVTGGIFPPSGPRDENSDFVETDLRPAEREGFHSLIERVRAAERSISIFYSPEELGTIDRIRRYYLSQGTWAPTETPPVPVRAKKPASPPFILDAVSYAENRDYQVIARPNGEVDVYLFGRELARKIKPMGTEIEKVEFTPGALLLHYANRMIALDARTLEYRFSREKADFRVCRDLFFAAAVSN